MTEMRGRYTYCIYVLLAALGLSGCELIHDDDLDCQLYTPEGVPYAYVSIALSTAMTPSTRANPTGGEGGDGPEEGQDYENEVNDITLFFYDVEDAPDGVNSAAATPIPVIRQYFSKNEINYENGQTYATTKAVPVEELLVTHNYHVLAVVNGGENFGTDIATLGQLQQATVTKLYNNENDTYTNFLMASADDESQPLLVRPNNSETNPATTRIDVERITARVDYKAEDSYKVETNGGNNIGTARITGAMLVNTLNANQPSYLLKRVTEESQDINSDPIWLGKETYTVSTGAATNYVIAPLTKILTPENASDKFSSENYFPLFSYETENKWKPLLTEGVEVKDPDGKSWRRIGYPKENTAVKADYRYTTGVVFQADFLPNECEEDDTFFEWNGTIYRTVEEAMQAFDKTGWQRIVETDPWDDITTWELLRSNIITGLRTGDPAGYKSFLEEQSKDKSGEIKKEDKAILRWSRYMANRCHYAFTEGKVNVDINDVEGATRAALAPFGLATYYKGICYYTYWIKHANDLNVENDMATNSVSGSGDGVMEYAIVRNNVYKLNVTGITQLGDDIPGNRTLLINVSVRNWELITTDSEEIELKPMSEE